MLHLSNVSTYKVTNKTKFLLSVKDVKTNWEIICQKQCVSVKFKETIDNAHPNCPVLNVLIKTHKMTEELIKSNDASKFSCRPIISGCDGPTDRVSWLLMYIFTPLLDFISAHLKNTKQVLDNLNPLTKIF